MAPQATITPLSWQQRELLQYEAALTARPPHNCVVAVPVSGDLREGDVRAYLERLIAAEEILTARMVTRSSGDTDGWIATPTTPPLTVDRLSGDGDVLSARLSALASTVFDRTDLSRPLWRVVMLPPPAAESATGGVLCAVFDHLICDGVSLEQFAAGVASPTLPLVGSAGTYNAWLRWQLRTFTDAPNADSAFWRSHLDGTPANMPTPFPAPSVVTPGTYHVAEVASPVTASELRQACVRLRTTPLPLILGATASAISRLAAAEAVTLHVVLAARPALYARVFGFLANTVPIRLSTPRLPDLAYAFARARAVWPDIIDHQFAPYEYVKRMCGSVTTPAAGNVRVQVNYLPASIPSLPVSTSGDERLPRSSTLAITVEHVRDGRHVFHARCHSHTLEPDLVAACVEAIAQGWLELVRGP